MRWAAVLLAAAVGGCGATPRPDYAEGAVMERSYAADKDRLAGCIYDRLRKQFQIAKAEFPERHTTRIEITAGLSHPYVELIEEGPDRTRASAPIPATRGEFEPEKLLAEVDACAKQR
jgi:hypothetical protein